MVVAKSSHAEKLKSLAQATNTSQVVPLSTIGIMAMLGIFKCRTNIGFNEMASSGICAEL
jgi:hypothetical protein